jgi:peptidoglycan/LPS O-acetylase OafA/YrhL
MSGSGYIKSLDGLRAMAILLVLSLHTGVLHFGWIGVQLFFVLSGFLITGILWKEKSREEATWYKFKKFWVRRALRILPLYYGYLLVLGITYLLFHFPDTYRTYMPWLLTYTYNFTRTLQEWTMDPSFAHLWSLAIEEQFYLFFPLILFLAPPKVVKGFMIAVIVLTPVSRFLIGQHYIDQGFRGETLATIVYWNSFSHLDAFFIGGLIPVLSLDRRLKRPWTLLTGCLALALVTGALNYIHHPDHSFYPVDLGFAFGQTTNYVYVWHYTVLNLLFAATILVLVSVHTQDKPSALRRLWENKWLVGIGKVSYGMYIYHWMIWYYLFEGVFKPVGVKWRVPLFIPFVIVVYIVASLSFKYFESFFIRLKDRLYPARGKGGKKEGETPSLPNLKTPLEYE